jgi:hypothetical protein
MSGNDNACMQLLHAIEAQKRGGQQIPGVPYQSIEDYVLRLGAFFTPAPRPGKWKLGTPKNCFDNSQRLALKSNLAYCEGFALAFGVPFLHGWCVDDHGNVIDVTWEEASQAYFGVIFDADRVRTHRGRRRWAASILDNPPAFPEIFGTRFCRGVHVVWSEPPSGAAS